MSKTISINAGSSSLKWQLYQMPEETVLAKGLIERIGLKDSISTVKFDGRSEKQVLDIQDHRVSSDLHEWCNDLSAVLTGGLVQIAAQPRASRASA